MAEVFGRPVAEIRGRVGWLGQVIRVDQFVEADGPERGARRIRAVNGSGLEVELHPDRALDLGLVLCDGIPISWMSPTGMAAPGLASNRRAEWLRTFGGGLLATCGLDTFGPPNTHAGGDYGLHGRVGSTPARLTRCEATEQGIAIEGVVRQAAVFGEHLVLHRRVWLPAGERRVTIHDTVTNEGFRPEPHLVLYHANIGWPLLDDGAVLRVPNARCTPRDDAAARGVAQWHTFQGPQAGFAEQVFRHDLPEAGSASDGLASATLSNAALGLSLTVHVDQRTLPHLFQWKMLGQGEYVLGLEPANCASLFGRAAAIDSGDAVVLQPGESRDYRIAFAFTRSP